MSISIPAAITAIDSIFRQSLFRDIITLPFPAKRQTSSYTFPIILYFPPSVKVACRHGLDAGVSISPIMLSSHKLRPPTEKNCAHTAHLFDRRGGMLPLPVCRRFNLPYKAQQLKASTTTRREKTHSLPCDSRERRASAKVTHNVGSIMTRSLGQAFLKACGSRAEPWEPTDTHYLTVCFRRP